jgi:hypothetical protein
MLNHFHAGFYLRTCSLNLCLYLGSWYFNRIEPNRVQCDSVKCCKDRTSPSLEPRYATIQRHHTGNPYRSNDQCLLRPRGSVSVPLDWTRFRQCTRGLSFSNRQKASLTLCFSVQLCMFYTYDLLLFK